MVEELGSPTFDSLGGAKISQEYDVKVLLLQQGTNYENAYRHELNILGEIFDELYTKTGVTEQQTVL